MDVHFDGWSVNDGVFCCAANNVWFLADSQVILLRSWKLFVQSTLQRSPFALGATSPAALGSLPTSLPYRYLDAITQYLLEAQRNGRDLTPIKTIALQVTRPSHFLCETLR
jgi:hypothetical protein